MYGRSNFRVDQHAVMPVGSAPVAFVMQDMLSEPAWPCAHVAFSVGHDALL